MSQFNWTVVGQNGKRYQIGLYHGSQSGHLMVYCNFKVMLIDFSVLESKTYTFFLDDELCELSLERYGDHFRYGLNLNKEADTPLNRKRKILDKRNMINAGIFLASLVLAIALIIFGIKYFQNNQSPERKEERLQLAGETTPGRLIKEEGSNVWTYVFVADNKSYSFKLTDGKLQNEFAYPLPLASGDEFQITFDRQNPNIHRIDWDSPKEKVIERMEGLLFPLLQSWHPEMSAREIRCQLESAYELEGLDGLSDLYAQNKEDDGDRTYNHNSYLRLIRSPAYQKLFAEKCW